MTLSVSVNTFTADFTDGTSSQYLKGIILRDILKLHNPEIYDRITLANVNYKIVSLQTPVHDHSNIEWIEKGSEISMRSLRATLILILLRAATEIFPDRRLRIDHSMGEGIYCQWCDELPFNTKDLKILEKHIQKIIDMDDPIIPLFMDKHQAMDQLLQMGEDPLLYGINQNKRGYIFYQCGELITPIQYPVFPSTGYAREFGLHLWSPGLILQFPRWDNGLYLKQFEEPKKLFNVFQEYSEWSAILGINKAADINMAAASNRIQDLIKIAEGLQEKRITAIAEEIRQKSNSLRLVLIAGPSSSGKTTFTKRLRIQLRVAGLQPLIISLDDYYLEKGKTPLAENGLPDYESLLAIDVDRLNQDIINLLAGKIVKLPSYDFKTGERTSGVERKLGSGQPLLLEGIHVLNNELTREIPIRSKLKIYVSALTQMNIMDNIRIPTSDVRLFRRIMRDVQFRNHSPAETINRWPEVRAGEEKYIFPLQEEADIIFNSSLMYELCIFKNPVFQFLKKIPVADPAYPEALRLTELLNFFLPVEQKSVPANSILREFIGSSSFEY